MAVPAAGRGLAVGRWIEMQTGWSIRKFVKTAPATAPSRSRPDDRRSPPPSLSPTTFRMARSHLQARPIYQHKRESIDAHLSVVFAALAVTRFIENRTGWSIKRFVRTTRRYRTVQPAGPIPVAENPSERSPDHGRRHA